MTKSIKSSQEFFKIISDTFQRWGGLKELKAYEKYMLQRGKVGRMKSILDT
jgi:hypothetical protein